MFFFSSNWNHDNALGSRNAEVATVSRRQKAFCMECQSPPRFLAAIECFLRRTGGLGGDKPPQRSLIDLLKTRLSWTTAAV